MLKDIIFSLVIGHVEVVCLRLLALREHVHVRLAHTDLTSILLHALEQTLVESHAWVLLLLNWLHLLLLAVIDLLLSSGWLLVSSVAAAAATHHGTDGLVAHLGARSESRSLHHGAHQAATTEAHSTALLRSGLIWLRRGPGWGCLGPGGAPTREEATTTTTS